jgi:hypothetical protein
MPQPWALGQQPSLKVQTWPLVQQKVPPNAVQTSPLGQHWPLRQVDPLAQVPQFTGWPQLFVTVPQVVVPQVVATGSGVQQVPLVVQTWPALQQVVAPVEEVQTWPLGQQVSPPTQVWPLGQQVWPLPQTWPVGQQRSNPTHVCPLGQQKPLPIPQTWPLGQQVPLTQLDPLAQVPQFTGWPQLFVTVPQVVVPQVVATGSGVQQVSPPTQTWPLGQQVWPLPQTWPVGQQAVNPTHVSPLGQQMPPTGWLRQTGLLDPTLMPQVLPLGQQPFTVQLWPDGQATHAAPPVPQSDGHWEASGRQFPLLSQQPLGQLVLSQTHLPPTQR